MGFIERLKQKIEADELARLPNRQSVLAEMAAREAEEAVRLQKAAQAEALHKQRREQAKAFHKESGVSDLVYRLSEIIHGEVCYQRGNVYSLPGGPPDHLGLPISREDPDSAIPSLLRWGTVDMGETGDWRKFVGKYLTIETCPDGMIIFHAGKKGSSRISAASWRNNPDLLEDALERAYNQPGNHVHLRHIIKDRHIGMA